MRRHHPYSEFHLAPLAPSRMSLSTLAELVAIALFIAGLAVSLAGMHETHLAAQAAAQLGGENQ